LRWMVEHHPENQTWPCILAVFYADLGRQAETRATYEAIVGAGFSRLREHQNYAPALAWLARVCALLRDTARAPEIYARLLPYADANIVLGPNSQTCLGSTHRYLGLLAITMRQIDEAERHYQAAIAMNERMGARPVIACCQHEYARVLERRNRPGD